MNKRRRYALWAGVIALAVGAALVKAYPRLVSLRFTCISGERVDTARLRGHPIVVTFWSSDCRTCLLEIPEFDRLSREFAPQGVRVFGVAVAYDLPSRVISLVREAGLGYGVALDIDGQLAAAFGGVPLVPETFLLDSEGRIRHSMLGPVDFGRVRQWLEAVLHES